MKLYCKIKQDGVWKWLSADSPWKKHIARELCECRVCKPNSVCPGCGGSLQMIARASCSNHEVHKPEAEE